VSPQLGNMSAAPRPPQAVQRADARNRSLDASAPRRSMIGASRAAARCRQCRQSTHTHDAERAICPSVGIGLGFVRGLAAIAAE